MDRNHRKPFIPLSRRLPAPLRWGAALVVLLAPLGVAPLGVGAASPAAAQVSPQASTTKVPAPASPPLFVDEAAAWGLDFVHFPGSSGRLYFPEMMGGGVALADFDGDEDLDLFFVQGHLLGQDVEEGAARLEDANPPLPSVGLGDRLYLNQPASPGSPESPVAGGPRRFIDATAKAGLEGSGTSPDGYGMGVATGDYDNDGDIDIYIPRLGSNALLRNGGDATFENVTVASGAQDDRWSIAATFVDFDGDGWLDLFVANYVAYTVRTDAKCYSHSTRRDYCGPAAYPPESDRLLRNLGDGTFQDVSAPAGLAKALGPGLGLSSADFDGDHRPDLFVANDGEANFLWINSGDGRFEDLGLLSGVALSRQGKPEASMGVAVGDIDSDGDPDLLLTHLAAETNSLYRNDGDGLFTDVSIESGLGGPSLPYTAFGTSWLDWDNDGLLDLAVANGAVKIDEGQAAAGAALPLAQPNQLFQNLGGGRFEEVLAERAGADAIRAGVGRGLAVGDVDNDGDADLVLTDCGGPARLLINQQGSQARWVGLRVVESAVEGAAPRDAFGALVEVEGLPGPRRVRRVATDGSYAAASDPRVLFGFGAGTALGDAGKLSVRVTWPDGTEERFSALSPDRYHVVRRGSGASVIPEGGAS